MALTVLSPSGTLLVHASGANVLVFDLSHVGARRVLSADLAAHRHSESVRAIAFSEDGAMLATSGDDKRLLIFATSTWTLLASYLSPTHPKKITALAFAPARSAHPPSHILLADRFGDVQALTLTAPSPTTLTLSLDVRASFGHFSLVSSLGLAGTVTHPLVISADADQRIRVAHWPHTFNIQSICLAHELYVVAGHVLAHPTPFSLCVAVEHGLSVVWLTLSSVGCGCCPDTFWL